MTNSEQKPSKIFSITRTPYKKTYRILGIKWSKRYPLKELRAKLNECQAAVQKLTKENNNLALKTNILSPNGRYECNKPISYDGENNQVIIIKENGETVVNPAFIQGLDVQMSGQNNSITIHEPYSFNKATISLSGDIDILIKKNAQTGLNFSIRKTRNILPNTLTIGEDFQCGHNCTIDLTDAGNILIGDDAKWSWNIYIKSDDTHPVFDVNTKKCLNKSTQITIGRHVWIGMDALVLKNSEVKDNSVIGARAVVAKKFDEENVAIAGNPAKVCKTGVNWAHGSVQGYINKNKEER